MAFLLPAAAVAGAGASTASTALTTASVIGGVLSAGSSLLSASAQASQNRKLAQIAENNAAIAGENAATARKSGQTNAYQQDTVATRAIGEQVANQGASGVDIGSRSSIGAVKSSKVAATQDRQNILNKYENEAKNYASQQEDFYDQADAYNSAASSSIWSGVIGAGTSLIGSYTSYYKYATL